MALSLAQGLSLAALFLFLYLFFITKLLYKMIIILYDNVHYHTVFHSHRVNPK